MGSLCIKHGTLSIVSHYITLHHIVSVNFIYKYRVYKKKLNKPETAHRLCKTSQCTKFFIEIGCLGTDNVV